ncbi:MAG: hypothetical protein GYB68_06780 [Chloroflexi bacterium]|nr:hypothetical protein [Chloroflexota bacterium]
MSREDKFFKMCTELPYAEEKDPRDEHTIPELAKVAQFRDNDDMASAIEYAQALAKMFSDFDLVPFMIAYMQYADNKPGDALSTAIEAIPKCPRKYRLYSVAGLSEIDQGHVANALVWFTRSAIAQSQVLDFQEVDAYLYLAHAAAAIGATGHADVFFTMTDAIDPSSPRLDKADADRLAPLKDSWAKNPFIKALEYIELHYLRKPAS